MYFLCKNLNIVQKLFLQNHSDPTKLIEIQAGKHSKSAKSRGSCIRAVVPRSARIRTGCASSSGVLQPSPVWDLSSACLVRDLDPLRFAPFRSEDPDPAPDRLRLDPTPPKLAKLLRIRQNRSGSELRSAKQLGSL